MAGWRALKRRARLDLHRAFEVPAFYRAPGSALWVKCRVRVHDYIDELGRVRGTSHFYAEREEMIPKIIFLASEVIPERGGIVSIEAEEAYRLDHTEPRDNVTISADAIRLSINDIQSFPTPDPTDPDFLCQGGGFAPKAQYGLWETSIAPVSLDTTPTTIPLDDQRVDNFNAPLNTHSFTNLAGEFVPVSGVQVYEFQVAIKGVSGISNNDLTVNIGTFSASKSVDNTAGRTTYVSFMGVFFADNETPLPLTIEARGPFTAENIKFSVSPRIGRTKDALMSGHLPSHYIHFALNQNWANPIDSEFEFYLNANSVINQITATGCEKPTWLHGAKLASNSGNLYQVQVRVSVTSLAVENAVTITLGDEAIDVDLPAPTGDPVTISFLWNTIMDEDKGLKIKPRMPIELHSVNVEVIPR
jgi:hypothetical protein